MNTSLTAKALGLMATTTLVLAACAPASEETPATTPSDAMTHGATADEVTAKPEPTQDAIDGAAADADTPAMEVVEQLQFTSTLLSDGAVFDGTSLAETDTILWFWAPWCPTCQAELPEIAEASANLPDGVTIIGVPGQSDVDSMKGFTSDYGLEGVDHIVDEDGSLWANFDVAYQPAFALINDDGTITTVPGSMSTEGILEAANQLAAS